MSVRDVVASVSAATVLILASSELSTAEDKPKWEVGLGASAVSLPDYIGSDERRIWVVPFPYFIYRGERVRVDREAIHGKLLATKRFRLELSLVGAIPVDSDDNEAREGMPNLDWTGQAGPKLTYDIWAPRGAPDRLLFELPVRGVVTTDFTNLTYEGMTSSPRLRYRTIVSRWNFESTLGVEFANSRYNNYIYGVKPEHATAERRVFDPDGGYAGVRASAGFSRRWGKLWAGAFVRYINISGTAFDDSPLVGTEHSVLGGIAMAWVFAESKHMVTVAHGEAEPN